MKLETVNAIVGCLALVLASVTAWAQFAPTSDNLQVVSEGRVNLGRPTDVVKNGTFDLEKNTPQPTIGPATWKVRVHNETDRVVSIVGWQIFLLTKDGGRVKYSAMRELLSPVDPSLPILNLPINIAAHETAAYFVSASVPFDGSAIEKSACFEPRRSLADTEQCVLASGKDIFGNSVSVVRYDPDHPEIFSATWEGQMNAPSFYLEFETADGSVFPAVLSFLPF